MRVTTILSAISVVAALVSSENAFAQGRPSPIIPIETGHSHLMTFDRQFTDVVLADPQFADVQPKGDRILLINAKQTVGATSLTVLDDAGDPVYLGKIVVLPPSVPGQVTIHARKDLHDYFTYSCTPGCTLVEILPRRGPPQ
jgi:Flp pilus assembly secretin CpaC